MAKTYLEDVYASFLDGISDYTFVADTRKEVEEVEEVLFGYFKKARAKFYRCRQSLDIFPENEEIEENGEIIEVTRYYFGKKEDDGRITEVELTEFEIMILAHLMTVEYMKQQVLASEVIKQSLSDKDFKIYSQANQLRELNLLYRLMQREANKMITEYGYMELGK